MSASVQTFSGLQGKLSDRDFARLSAYISSTYGIKMPESKRSLLQARLQKRLRAHRLTSYEAYCDLLFSKESGQQEAIHMIDVVSTNKTDFFRESNHFDFMRSHVLPGLTKSSSLISFWSAGCSSGEEVYTICMVVDDYMRNRREVQYNVIGSDISTEVLHTAANAIYAEERVAGLPLELRKRYFLKSKDPSRKQVRVVPDLRNRTRFIRLNFMDNKYSQIPVGHDVIFCRNVLIYFDKYTQEAVIKRLCNHLRPGGYFFLGHSESIMGMEVPLKQIKPTIFQKV